MCTDRRSFLSAVAGVITGAGATAGAAEMATNDRAFFDRLRRCEFNRDGHMLAEYLTSALEMTRCFLQDHDERCQCFGCQLDEEQQDAAAYYPPELIEDLEGMAWALRRARESLRSMLLTLPDGDPPYTVAQLDGAA